MYAEEVDLNDVELLVANPDLGGNAADGRNQFSRFGGSHSDMPYIPPTGRHQSPIISNSAFQTVIGTRTAGAMTHQ